MNESGVDLDKEETGLRVVFLENPSNVPVYAHLRLLNRWQCVKISHTCACWEKGSSFFFCSPRERGVYLGNSHMTGFVNFFFIISFFFFVYL